jgi:hypothetical protein
MLADSLSEQVTPAVVSDLSMQHAAQIVKEKYGAAEWNCRR